MSNLNLPNFSQPNADDSAMPILRETYPLKPPHSFALIQTDPVSNRTIYQVTETPLTTEEGRIYKFIKDVLVEELDVDFKTLSNEGKAEEYLKRQVNETVRTYRLALSPESLDKIMYYIDRDLIGYGPLEPLMHDHLIEDISLDGLGVPVYVWHRTYESIATNIIFEDENELDSFIIKLAQRSGRHISMAQPLLDASLPDGSRLQLSFGREVTQKGSTFTMRRFRADPWTITDLVITNTIDPKIAAYYWYLVEHQMSVLICGGTASGKTSFMNSLSMLLKPDLKVVSIEDTAELNIGHENWIPSVARGGFGSKNQDGTQRGEITMYDLLRAAMRQRPDFILVGEIRGQEAYTLFQAMSTGHAAMGTIHGDSVQGVIGRLESAPMNVPRAMIKALDLIHVQQKVRLRGKFARRAVEITEVLDLDPNTKHLLTNKVYSWNATKDNFTFYGRSYLIEKIKKLTGRTDKECWDEIGRREIVIRWLMKKQIRHFRDVSAQIADYYANPEKVFKKAERVVRGV